MRKPLLPDFFLVVRSDLGATKLTGTRYFYGLPWSKHIVIYDTLIDKSSAAEVEAVLAHELGHWYFCESLVSSAPLSPRFE